MQRDLNFLRALHSLNLLYEFCGKAEPPDKNLRKMKIIPILFLSLSPVLKARSQTYWQQKADTKIEVTLDDENHFLRGFEHLYYQNNSPDTLHYIYIHLW